MRRIFLLAIMMGLFLNETMGGIYNCSSSNAEPVEIKSNTSQVLISRTASKFPVVAQSSVINIKNKTPFLIYYSIDSTEALMKYSVKYETASLIEKCKDSTHVNFAAIINSLYTENNQIIVCKNKKFELIDLKHFPALDKRLKAKRKYLSKGDHTEEDDDKVLYRSLYMPESNQSFGRYPLAHPDFLYELVNLVTTEKELFPKDQYSPFLNLKSHGSKYNVLAGMHSCQEKAKELSANQLIKQLLTPDEIKFLEKQKTYEKVVINLNEYERIISKIGLGRSRMQSTLNSNSSSGMGAFNMGVYNMSDTIAGLGVDQGLGGDLTFGVSQPNLNWVLDDLFPNDSTYTLGFLLLESCDTHRDMELFHSYMTNIYAYYSAEKSLWYRNLNWWELLNEAEGSSEKLVELLKIATAEIPNMELVQN